MSNISSIPHTASRAWGGGGGGGGGGGDSFHMMPELGLVEIFLQLSKV